MLKNKKNNIQGGKMRKLVILRGAMGSGKSTFIKENHLENFTLSSDQIRLMLNAPEMNTNYQEEIPQFNNQKVWEILYMLLEERMKKGEFTLIDAVHAHIDSLNIYKKLATKYRYRLYILDFTTINKEEVFKRNQSREEYKRVPEYAIDRTYKIFAKEKIPSSFQILEPKDFQVIFNTTPKNMNIYNQIHIIGDIHGCYTTIKKYFDENPLKQEDAYIFLGDYFDRGIENAATFKFLTELMNNKNTTFLIGNHEDKLYKYACEDEFKMDYDSKNTIQEFESNTITKSEIRGFMKQLAQIAYIKFGDKTYLLSHGGIPYFPKKALDFFSTNTFIYGTDNYEINIDEIYNNYMEKEENKIYQIHGHRNFHKIKYNTYPYSFNLEGDIEHGGYLRILTLMKNNEYHYDEIKNNIYNPNLIEETNVYNLIESLRKNKYILERFLDSNISSYNFTKEAFHYKIWDNLTTKARGLFIDTEKNIIIARSYDKFFKVNERRETNLDGLEKSFVFPISFYIKYNGFLGILSLYKEQLFFASKSSNKGDYVEYFKKIFYKKYNQNQIEALKKKMQEENATLVFEVMDPLNDPHIIEYQESNLILLDCIKNTTSYSKISYEELKTFASLENIEIKELAYTANNIEEFMSIYEKITSVDYKWKNENIEGFVIEDASNFMVKTKTYYYDTWKRLRTKVEEAMKNHNFNVKFNDELEESFLTYIQKKYEHHSSHPEKINIIKERNEFQKR